MALRFQALCDWCGTAYQQTAADEKHQMRCGKALSARQVAPPEPAGTSIRTRDAIPALSA